MMALNKAENSAPLDFGKHLGFTFINISQLKSA